MCTSQRSLSYVVITLIGNTRSFDLTNLICAHAVSVCTCSCYQDSYGRVLCDVLSPMHSASGTLRPFFCSFTNAVTDVHAVMEDWGRS